jgi:hypothetical protein
MNLVKLDVLYWHRDGSVSDYIEMGQCLTTSRCKWGSLYVLDVEMLRDFGRTHYHEASDDHVPSLV